MLAQHTEIYNNLLPGHSFCNPELAHKERILGLVSQFTFENGGATPFACFFSSTQGENEKSFIELICSNIYSHFTREQ
jgi:hypothetical protein